MDILSWEIAEVVSPCLPRDCMDELHTEHTNIAGRVECGLTEYQLGMLSSGKYTKLPRPTSYTCTLNGYINQPRPTHMHTSKAGLVQTVKSCFPGLSRTCNDQIPGFSRTHKTRFLGLSRINSVHKHGCIRSKKCTYQISYRCNCITVNKPKCNNCCCINVLQ